jgi:PAS domain S-box-containing protein
LVDTVAEAVRRLSIGDGDVALLPRLVGLLTIKKLALNNIERNGPRITTYGRGFSFAVQEGNAQLLALLNQGLAIVKATGRYDKIYDKWFGVVDPRGISIATIYKDPAIVGGGFLIALIITLIWSWSLKREVLIRKHAESALREAQKIARIGSWEYLVIDDKIIWSKETYEIYQIPLNTPINYQLLRERIYPEDRLKHDQNTKDWIDGVSTDPFNYRIILPDDSVRHILAMGRVEFNEQKKTVRMSGVVQDVTEQQQAEEILREYQVRLEQQVEARTSELRYSESVLREERDFADRLVNTAQTIILVLDLESRIARCNPYFLNITGYTMAEVIGLDWFSNFLPVDDHEKIRAIFKESIANIRTLGNINPILTKDGQLREIEWYNITLKGGDDKITGVLAIGYDVTKRLELEEEREQALVNAESANLAKSEFLAIMSHEIRTPLNAILGMAAVALESVTDIDQARYLEIISRSGNNLLALIEDILDLSHIEAGRLTLELNLISLNELVKEALDIHSHNANSKGIKLSSNIGVDTPNSFLADKKRLRQVLLNLVGNGVKFTEQGRVEIMVSCPSAKIIKFSVVDSGIGIPKEKHELIFDPFSQADSSNTRQHGGVGLGLAICNRLVSAMNGEILVDSEPGKGSTFHFSIPLLVDDQNNKDLSLSDNYQKERVEKANNSISILLAEDNIDSALLIETYLKKFPHNLEIVESGELVVEKIRSGKRYSLVLMDIQMPGMDGIEATKIIRAFEKESNIPRMPIVALTANAMQGDKEKSLAAGCNSHATKPISKKKLLELVARFA